MDVDLARFLTVFGHVSPSIYDAIFPHGPLVAFGRASKQAQVALNPQPIPPGHELLLASANVAHEIAMAAVAAEAAGTEGASTIVTRAVDDWCGTRPPHIPIPWPGPWPGPWTTDYPGPDMDAIVPASRLVGALSFAAVASRMAEGDARDALTRGAEKLLETALSQD
jgi:hypothetical protein